MAKRPAQVSLRRIDIKGFKSIVDQRVELGDFNVLIGANGTGKTAVLESIGVLGAAAEGQVDDAALLRRGVRPGVPKLYKSAFADQKLRRVITIRAESQTGDFYSVSLDNPGDSPASAWRFSAETIGVEGRKVLTRSPRGGNVWEHGRKNESLPKLDGFLGLSRVALPADARPKGVDLLQDALRRFAIFDPQTSILRGTQPDFMQHEPIGLGGGRLAEAIRFIKGRPREQLAQEFEALVDWSSSVSATTPSPELISPSIPVTSRIVRFVDRFMREDRNELSAYDASEGALYVLFALTLALHHHAPRFYAVENVGHALHPRLARRLVSVLARICRKERRQVVVTTHNPLVLDSLDLSDDRVRLLAVERSTSGHTKISRIEHSDAVQKALDSGLTISQMWIRGLLGAVPAL